MIKIFGPLNEGDLYSSNGDIVIQPLKARVHKEDNGAYYLDLETNLSYFDYFVEGNLVVANTPQGDQPFRINNVQKTNHRIVVRANHVFYDTQNYLIADSYVEDKTCEQALVHLRNATEPANEFAVSSDVTAIGSFRCVRQSFYEAIQTVLERWGGHLVRDGFSISIMNSVGADNGVVVRYGKNLKDITCEENWDNVVTKLLPVGRDGLLLNAIDPDADIYVTSWNPDTEENPYPIPYTKTVSFDQEIDEEAFTDEDGNLDEAAYTQALLDDLREQAQAYVERNSVPQINYTLHANLERMTDIGDTVAVIDERLGLDILTHVISFEYDCILKRYTSVEFGNFEQTLSGLMDTISDRVEEKTETVRIALNRELRDATDRIWSALDSGYVVVEQDKILLLDNIPITEAQNVIIMNNEGIGFSSNGIAGPFNSAWTIDGTLNMQNINVIGLSAEMIQSGSLVLGAQQGQIGSLELYDANNRLIAEMTPAGLTINAEDGSKVVMDSNGLTGKDANNNPIYWVAADQFHMSKAVIENEITLCNELRFIPITVRDGNNNIVNEGIGLVSVAGGGS